MKRTIIKLQLLPIILASLLSAITASAVVAAEVIHIKVVGAINPVSAQFMIDAVDIAEREGAGAVLIELDTPGGLLEATRMIVQRFLAANVPVIVYVSPAGARAGSAGTFITLAAHVAAMAPSTNIGAAHPVSVGGGGMPGSEKPDSASSSVMNDKMTNDAAAMIRSIAEARGRNAEWAEKAVRESASITATDALNMKVIDVIAPDVDSLMAMIDGKVIKLADKEITLNTSSVTYRALEMTWRERMLDRLSDPNIAYIFMMLGIYGLMFELYSPGSIFPGVIGVISLLVAFMAFQTLPVNAVGIILIVMGIIMFILEIKVISHGILSIGGVVSLLLGSLMLIDSDIPEMRVSLSVIIPSVVGTAVFFLFAVGMAIKAQKKKVTTGTEGIVGLMGEALSNLEPKGQVFVHGEYWQAKSAKSIAKGATIKVVGADGIQLIVEECK